MYQVYSEPVNYPYTAYAREGEENRRRRAQGKREWPRSNHYTLEQAIEDLSDFADVPVELGTIDITFSCREKYGDVVLHAWIEEDGVPVEPLVVGKGTRVA